MISFRYVRLLAYVTLRSISTLFVLLLLARSAVYAQGSAGTEAQLESRTMIDLPTAGMLAERTLSLDMVFFQKGSVLGNFSVGIFNSFLIGVTYGGTSVIGSDPFVSNPRPGFSAKLRLIDEGVMFPGVAIGFDSQGKELFVDSLDRYAVKPLGFYAVGSKNYKILGHLSVHGGINYSIEQGDGNKNLNYFIGVEKTVGPFATTILEYNFNANDDYRSSLGNNAGYLSAGVRLSIGNGFTMGLNFKDIVKNQQSYSISNRTLQFEYIKAF